MPQSKIANSAELLQEAMIDPANRAIAALFIQSLEVRMPTAELPCALSVFVADYVDSTETWIRCDNAHTM